MRQTIIAFAVAVGLVVGAVPVGAVATSTGTSASTDVVTAQDQCSFPFNATDGTGEEITVEERPERIVALQASTAQILWEIGAKDRVVGMPVRDFTAYLDGSEEKTNIFNEDSTVNIEQVVALEPDIVIAPDAIENGTIEQLRNAGLTVYKSGLDKSIEGIYEKTELYGNLVGNCEEADTVVEEMRSTVEEIETAVEGRENPRVLYYFYNFTAGENTFIHEIIETAGGDNIAANAGISTYEQVNREIVAERNPEWILHPNDAPLPTGEPYTSTIALRQNQTLTLNANYMNQAGPRIVIPLQKIAKTLHPEAFTEETTTTTPTTTTSTNGTTVETTSMPTTNGSGGDGVTTAPPSENTTTSSGSGPGFGVVTALVALVAAALLGRPD